MLVFHLPRAVDEEVWLKGESTCSGPIHSLERSDPPNLQPSGSRFPNMHQTLIICGSVTGPLQAGLVSPLLVESAE